MTWTPEKGARTAAARLGKVIAISQLSEMLIGIVPADDVSYPPWRSLIRDVAGVDADWVTGSAAREYWPRAWAARALAYVGDASAIDALTTGARDDHWRVRMNSVRALGVIGSSSSVPAILPGADDPHPRVREAAARALGRTGDGVALTTLGRLAADEDPMVAATASRALERLVAAPTLDD